MALKSLLRNQLPDSLVNLYLLGKKRILPQSLRWGDDFSLLLKILEESQWWTDDQIKNYQWENIKTLLTHAYRNVPYYQSLFSKIGLHPEDIRSFADFEKIPLLTREEVGRSRPLLIAKNHPLSKLVKKYTGGTTGAPVDFYEEKQTELKENAFYWRFWRWFGYHPEDKCAILRGNNKTKKHRFNLYKNYLEIGAGDLSSNNIADFLTELKKFNPSFIQAYPSIAFLVAQHINQTNQSGHYDFIRVIFCASEKLFSFQRNEIKKAFNCRVIDCYGHSERVVLMQQCEQEGNLHIIPEYGYTELIDDEGRVIKEPGKLGEIVGTGFNNRAFPFIRYRTGDFALLSGTSCACGRNYTGVTEIQGRSGDYLVAPSGKLISPTLVEFAFDSLRNVREWQVIQRNKNLIEVVMVAEENYDNTSGLQLKSELLSIINEPVNLEITYHDSIQRPDNLKHRFVVNELDKKQQDGRIEQNKAYTRQQEVEKTAFPYYFIRRIDPLIVRYGKKYKNFFHFITQTQWWDADQLREYQLTRTREILNYAYKNVPYYQKLFRKIGFDPPQFKSLDDIKKLPYLTKEIVLKNNEDLTSRDFPKRNIKTACTGGTSGTPMQFHVDRQTHDVYEQAFVWRHWNWVGYQRFDRKIVLRGEIIKNKQKYRRNIKENAFIFSSYHLDEKHIEKYLEIIDRFTPKVIQGYPSSLEIFARHLHDKNVKLSIPIILTSSETLSLDQRAFIQQQFNGHIYDLYGHSERIVAAAECDRLEGYHVYSDYGFMEIVDVGGNDVKDESTPGEIVGTGFYNYAMPFIRYKTGDLATISQRQCSCGRAFSLIRSLAGRAQDYFVDGRGTLIPFTGGTSGIIFKDFPSIKKIQYYQDRAGEVVLKLVKDRPQVPDLQNIQILFHKRYGNHLNLHIAFVDDIPRTEAGKYKYLDQKIKTIKTISLSS